MGYKVNSLPYAPFKFPLLDIFHKDSLNGDPYKYWKTVLPAYDITVSNGMQHLFLDISNPDFLKHFYSNEHLYSYPKSTLLTGAVSRALGKGIILSEGEQWKRKRKIISEVFNF